MRRVAKYLVILVFGFAVGYLVVSISNKYRKKKVVEKRIQTLPKVTFPSVFGDSINLHTFDQNRIIILIYFHPDCEHCQYEAQEIGQNALSFSNCQLVMVTPDDSLQRVNSFCETNHLWEVDNIEVLIDTANQFKTVFGKAVIPSVYIYGTDRKLKKHYLGETRIDLIIAEISAIE